MRGFSFSLLFSKAILVVANNHPNVTAAAFHFPSDVCGINSWPYNGIGVPLTAQLPSSKLRSILEQVDPLRIQAIIEKLVSFGTRATSSSQTDPNRGIGAARDWILWEYQKYAECSEGRTSVELQSFIQPISNRITVPTKISNIIATLKGTSDPGRIYVVSGHYDSRNTNVTDGINDAPGADDDASGVAVAMELARIMAFYKPIATIMFAAVAAEEQGLYGSEFMAQTLANASANVQGMYTNDIVGSPVGDDGKNSTHVVRLFAQGTPTNESKFLAASRLTVGGENDSPARELGRFTRDVASNSVTNMSVELVYRLDRYLRGGDHASFLAAGYPGNRFTEPREDFAHQHQDVRVENGTQYGDLLDFCDFYYISRVAKVNGAALWSLANAPGTPTGAAIDASNLTNNSTLLWKPVKGALGYDIVWRPTDQPFWTHVVTVGNVTKIELPLSKDNVIFGIRSVGPNGHSSPAAFPFPG